MVVNKLQRSPLAQEVCCLNALIALTMIKKTYYDGVVARGGVEDYMHGIVDILACYKTAL